MVFLANSLCAPVPTARLLLDFVLGDHFLAATFDIIGSRDSGSGCVGFGLGVGELVRGY